MTSHRPITLFHAPHSRSSGVLTLLEELNAPYELRVLNMKAGEQRQPPFLAINPLGKVPALLDGDTLVTEQVAIFIHLADRFPDAGLSPVLDDPRRGAYLRWLVYYAACYEPALVDRFLERPPVEPMHTPYGDFDTMLGVLETKLTSSPYLLGDTISAADVLWGVALRWGMDFGIVPKRAVFAEYAAQITARPAAQRVAERDAALAAAHEAAVKSGAHQR
ncbi:glutathione S-transferase family protein [Massilia sp. PAMC28688]|uniref:glutathione S-transferase family protein n=1 Tax=Massilia sp. PAMC28688 TaxID=2861283 RepID=UPI001C62F0F4|nr:glutathione S-transferase family protein [Massilia sp. PAMC28688]QYF92102.1 glutathione S-transferase family protein [Massilia sp. PAMC28688]